MATRRPTHGKRERDRAKKAKAAAKRERRQGIESPEGRAVGATAAEDGAVAVAPAAVDQAQVIARLEELHRRYDAEEIDFESFEEARAELLTRLTVD